MASLHRPAICTLLLMALVATVLPPSLANQPLRPAHPQGPSLAYIHRQEAQPAGAGPGGGDARSADPNRQPHREDLPPPPPPQEAQPAAPNPPLAANPQVGAPPQPAHNNQPRPDSPPQKAPQPNYQGAAQPAHPQSASDPQRDEKPEAEQHHNFAKLAVDALAKRDETDSMNKPPPPPAHGPDLPPVSGPEPPPPVSLPEAVEPILLSEKDSGVTDNGTAQDTRVISPDQEAERGHNWEGPAFVLFGFVPIAPWVVGVLFGITGYTFCGLGMNLIRLSHIVSGSAGSTIGAATTPLSTNHASTLRETPYNRPANPSRATFLWLSGYFFNSIGGSLNIAGLRFAAQSLMAPLSSTALIANAFFATVLCGERLSLPRDAPPMALITLGNTVTVLSANHKGFKDITVHEFSRLFFRPAFQTYLSFVVVIVIFLSILRFRFLSLVKRHGGREYASQNVVARMGLCHAAAGCMFCVHSALFSKGSMLILAQGFDHAIKPAFAPILITWTCLVSIWVYTLNRLLRDYDALFIIPVIEVVWSLQSMVSGGIFFDEYSSLSSMQLIIFCLGVAINITGVLLLSHRGDKKKLAE